MLFIFCLSICHCPGVAHVLVALAVLRMKQRGSQKVCAVAGEDSAV